MDSPEITRADGTKPYNGYLWPTEIWWLCRAGCIPTVVGHDTQGQPIHAFFRENSYDPRWHFGIIALSDGRFATEGTVCNIQRNNHDGRKVCFQDRRAAIRAAAARLIRLMRDSREWGYTHGGLKGRHLAYAINWVRSTVAEATSAPAPKLIHISDPLEKTGLPLFDYAKA